MLRQVSSACAAWATHTVILKFMLYLMGIPSAVPFLETVAYAGYPFVLVCLSAFVGAAAGVQPHDGHTHSTHHRDARLHSACLRSNSDGHGYNARAAICFTLRNAACSTCYIHLGKPSVL